MPKKVEIDWELLNSYLMAQCTEEQCAAALGISRTTLEKAIKTKHKMAFSEYKASIAPKGLADLLQARFKVAIEKGNPQMLIHLGKNYLGQKDKVENEVRVTEHNIDFSGLSTEELKELLGDSDD